MPTHKMTLNLLICASLALTGAGLFGQSSTPSSTAPASSAPATSTPSATPSAPSDQAPSAPSAQAPNAPDTQQASTTAQDCNGPVLHRKASAGGDICSDGSVPTVSGRGSAGDEEATNQPAGKNGNVDPNVNPFPQAQPDKNGMMPGVKQGTIDDVNAVGTRSVGARGVGNWYSTE